VSCFAARRACAAGRQVNAVIDLAMNVFAKDSETTQKYGLELSASNSANYFLGKRTRTYVARICCLTPLRQTLPVVFDRFVREKRSLNF
jgi:hypothetical protein